VVAVRAASKAAAVSKSRVNSPARAVSSRDNRADNRSPVKADSRINAKSYSLCDLPRRCRGFFPIRKSKWLPRRFYSLCKEWALKQKETLAVTIKKQPELSRIPRAQLSAPPEEGPRHSRRLKELILFTRVRIVTSNPEENNNMRLILTMALVAAAISTAAMAQPANRDANTPAVNTPNSPPNPGAPVAGANSFTEGQAKSRIESSGYTNISELRKDDQGVWRGKAMKDGQAVSISLDFQGNVTAQ
jgi:hypothetical protein